MSLLSTCLRSFSSALIVGLLLFVTGKPAFSQSPLFAEIGSITSDGSWLARVVSLGNYGTQAFLPQGSYLPKSTLVSTQGGCTETWSQQLSSTMSVTHQTASASQAPFHVSLAQKPSGGWFIPLLTFFQSDTSIPLWERELPEIVHGLSPLFVFISPDGNFVTTVTYKSIRRFSKDGTQLSEFPLSLGPITASVSNDGTRVAIQTMGGVLVINTVTALSAMLYNEEAPSISEDGKKLATRNKYTSQITVYDVTPSLVLNEQQNFTPNGWPLFLRVISSGTVFAAEIDGLSLYDQNGTSLFHYAMPGNVPTTLDLNTKGDTLAVGFRSNSNDSFSLFLMDVRREITQLISNLAGPVRDVAVGEYGNRIVATHTNYNNGSETGGSVLCYQGTDSDLQLVGAPTTGSTIEIIASGQTPGNQVFLLAAQSLNSQPSSYRGMPGLKLDPGSLTVLSETAVADAAGVARFLLPLGTDLPLGFSQFFQAISRNGLSKTTENLTILP